MTDEMVAFIRKQLDADAADALAAAPGPWHLNPEADEVIAVDDVQVAEVFALSNNQLRNTAAHIARHDPQRVLAEVAAKRRILDAWQMACDGVQEPWPDDRRIGEGDGLDEAVRCLAAVYADHPDYRKEWKP